MRVEAIASTSMKGRLWPPRLADSCCLLCIWLDVARVRQAVKRAEETTLVDDRVRLGGQLEATAFDQTFVDPAESNAGLISVDFSAIRRSRRVPCDSCWRLGARPG